MKKERQATEGVTQISFECKGRRGDAPSLTISGLDSDVINRPDKILQLMDLLELPKGTNARIVYSAGDVVAR